MKIALVTSSLRQGGAERQVAETALLLAREGHSVDLLLFSLEKPFYPVGNEKRIRVLAIDSRSIWTRLTSLARLLRRNRYSYALSFLEKPNLYLAGARLLLPSNGTAFAGSEESIRFFYSDSAMKRITFGIAYRFLDGLIVNTETGKREIMRQLRYPERRLHVLRNLLDTRRFHPLPPSGTEAGFTVLIPGRLCPEKNQKILLPIARLLRQWGAKELRFVLVGRIDTPYAAELAALIEEEGCAREFLFKGAIRDMVREYNEADVVFLPSVCEGLSNALIEAMSCERVTLSTDISDARLVIRDEENGFLVPPNDPKRAAEALMRCLALSPVERKRIGTEARRSILHLSPDRHLRALFAILEELAPGKTRSVPA